MTDPAPHGRTVASGRSKAERKPAKPPPGSPPRGRNAPRLRFASLPGCPGNAPQAASSPPGGGPGAPGSPAALIIAIIGIESRFNPFAESGVGAQGRMQGDPRLPPGSPQQGAGEQPFLSPATSIQVGVHVLEEEAIRWRGSLTAGLQHYGALQDPGKPLRRTRCWREGTSQQAAPAEVRRHLRPSVRLWARASRPPRRRPRRGGSLSPGLHRENQFGMGEIY